MKNAKKYIKLYYEKSQKSYNRNGYYYPPRNWDEFLAWENKGFDKFFADEAIQEQREHIRPKPRRYLSIFDSINDFGYLCAFEKMDYNTLNNVIFQSSKHNLLLHAMLGSGTNHSLNFLRVLSAYACNNFDLTKNFLPENLPHLKGASYNEVCVNLLKVMYYNQEEFATSSIEKAERFLTKKITAFEEHFVKIFIAIYQRNIAGVNISLQELCKAYQRQGYPVSQLDKCFAEEIHGLYRFIKIIDVSFFNEIKLPEHDCFFKEFEMWQKKNDYPKGKLFYEYPSKINYLNKILQAEIPLVTLQEYKKGNKTTLMTAPDDFALKLTKNIAQIE